MCCSDFILIKCGTVEDETTGGPWKGGQEKMRRMVVETKEPLSRLTRGNNGRSFAWRQVSNRPYFLRRFSVLRLLYIFSWCMNPWPIQSIARTGPRNDRFCPADELWAITSLLLPPLQANNLPPCSAAAAAVHFTHSQSTTDVCSLLGLVLIPVLCLSEWLSHQT